MTDAIYLGLDVQIRRKTAWMALDGRNRMVGSGWLEGESHAEIARSALTVLDTLRERGGDRFVVGIDSPRRFRPGLREFYWNRKTGSWRPRSSREVGLGRHCEVVVRAAGIANPQWTPVAGECPAWMELGFTLFRELEAAGEEVHEVFPSASYALLEGESHAPVQIDFSAFRPGKVDMIDACVAAFTVAEFDRGKGCEVGADGLGTIVLPRPLPETVPPGVLTYPEG